MTGIITSVNIFSMLLLSTIATNFDKNVNMPIKNSVVRPSENINYTKIVDFWKDHKEKLLLHEELQEVVLVMGNTGAGKSTLVSALIGKNLRSTMKDGYRVIVDEESRIGTGVSSKTMIPETMIDTNRNITYIDCAGFRDNRNIEYEISSIYFQNVLMQQVKRIKLILVINYDSVKFNGNKNDFDDLFEHVTELINEISKFHNAIALVATKVENFYEQFENGTVNDDKSVIDGIANFLMNKKQTYFNKTDNLEKNRKFMNLIDVLLQRHNNVYTRIAIFRQPNSQGLLQKIPKTKNEIGNIAKMTTENLHFVDTNKDDFGYTLSKSSKNAVDLIIDDIFKGALKNRLKKMLDVILTHYLQIQKEYSDIEVIHKHISSALDVIPSIRNINEPLKYFKQVLNAANTLNISVSLSNLNDISEDIKKLQFFTTLSNGSENTQMMLLNYETQNNIIEKIENLENFYDFLNRLQGDLARYESQQLKNDSRVANIVAASEGSDYKVVQNIKDLENIVKEISSDEYYRKIKTMNLNQFQLKHLRAIFEAFSSKLKILCTITSKQMTIKGFNVRITDAVNDKCWTQAQIIQVFALNKVFLDRTIDKIGAETQLFIFAPTWEVIGGPKIILDGKAGEQHNNVAAKSASFNSENGSDGVPGLPGGPAGSFFGVGKQFINSEQLEIHANGGKGGPGQNGGNGADGKPGEELPERFFETKRAPEEISDFLKNRGYEYSFTQATSSEVPQAAIISATVGELGDGNWYGGEVSGKMAIKPSDGGNGGAGGRGGSAGDIVILALGNPVNVKTSNNTGSSGLDGLGGHGGKKTSNGRSVTFFYNYNPAVKFTLSLVDFLAQFSLRAAKMGGDAFQSYTASFSSVIWTDGAEVPAGRDGKPGRYKDDEQITNTPKAESYPAIIAFKEFVRLNLYENIKESELRALVYELESENYIKAQYNTSAYVKEFEGIENRFFTLQNKIDLVPFYKSILNRIETFAISEGILENKKVLSFLYTAALTKVFTLKKKRRGKTVVNLYQYLSTIETSVKEIQESQHFKIVRNYQNDYENTLNSKIQKANDFIVNEIQPEIHKLWEESDNQIRSIIDEIKMKKKSTENELESMEKNMAKFREASEIRSKLLPLELSASALSFFGPVGATAGDAVKSSINIVKGLLLDKSSVQGENQIYSVNPNLNQISRVTEDFNDKLLTIAKSKDHKQELMEKTKTKRSTKTTAFSNVLQKGDIVETIFSCAKGVHESVKKIEDDIEMMRELDNQISLIVGQIKDLDKMEGKVYDILIPDLRQVEDTINAIKYSVNGSSHAELDLTKWSVQGTLRNLKSSLQKFTHMMSFELQSNLMRFVEKIDEGFSILLDIYDRIDSYSDSVKQAKYMAHIVSPQMTDLVVTDSKLNNVVIDLKLIMQSNILFEKYGIALNAFKEHYFPFAAKVLQKFQLPAGMRLNNTETLRSDIIKILNEMKNHIVENEATIDEYSKYTHDKSVFNSNITGASPFYVWKHDAIKDEVQRLLNGSEIVIKADIAKGIGFNSVKYTDIGINFKLANINLQNNLSSVLKNFTLTMTVIGNNYYRCGERYYFISFDDDISISYLLDKDEDGNWINPNSVYTTIRKSHPFLSPYGMWRIRLQPVNKFVSFDILNAFANETMDLELIGRGYYIEQNPDLNFDVCNDYLDTIYNVENIARELV